MDPQAVHITYIGHATTLIELNGARLLTDPIIQSRVFHLRRVPGRIDPAWHANIDVVLITHAHWDHLNIPSLRRFAGEPLMIVPPGVDKILRKAGLRNIETMEVGELRAIGSVAITAGCADHDGLRYRFFGDEQAVGYLVEGSQSVYFAGDTDVFQEMETIHDNLDVALLPVWGWGPTLGSGHMDPGQAARAAALLKPRVAIPIHWGTFFPIGLHRLMSRFLRFPPLLFKREMEDTAPDVRVEILQVGAQTTVGPA